VEAKHLGCYNDPLIYIEESGLIPVGNLSKLYFLSFLCV
jgi:hypothetical protein